MPNTRNHTSIILVKCFTVLIFYSLNCFSLCSKVLLILCVQTSKVMSWTLTWIQHCLPQMRMNLKRLIIIPSLSARLANLWLCSTMTIFVLGTWQPFSQKNPQKWILWKNVLSPAMHMCGQQLLTQTLWKHILCFLQTLTSPQVMEEFGLWPVMSNSVRNTLPSKNAIVKFHLPTISFCLPFLRCIWLIFVCFLSYFPLWWMVPFMGFNCCVVKHAICSTGKVFNPGGAEFSPSLLSALCWVFWLGVG